MRKSIPIGVKPGETPRRKPSPWSRGEVVALPKRRHRRRGRTMPFGLAVGAGLLAAAVFSGRIDAPAPLVDSFETTALPPPEGVTLAARPLPVCSGPVRRNCVVDGDTLWIDGEKIRIANINAPEVRGDCGAEIDMAARATAGLQSLVSGRALVLSRQGRDIYGRTLALVGAGGSDVGEILVRTGLAEEWNGVRIDWCGP